MIDLPPMALSVRQPWLWAIIHAGKDVENRTKYAITLGGMAKARRIALHASIGMTRAEYEEAREFMGTLGVACPRPDALVRGAIIGAATVTSIVKASESPWFFGPWALELAEVEGCDPVPCRGALGLFDWRRNQVKESQAPLPWMIGWPGKPSRPASPAPNCLLFDELAND